MFSKTRSWLSSSYQTVLLPNIALYCFYNYKELTDKMEVLKWVSQDSLFHFVANHTIVGTTNINTLASEITFINIILV